MDLSEKDLLAGLEYYGNYIFLKNEYVNIIITTLDGRYVLQGFYNRKKYKNAARCALYFLLKKLISDNMCDTETELFVEDISPSEGGRGNTSAYEKLINIYLTIGFSIESGDIESKRVVLSSTVSNLITQLNPQCLNFIGGKVNNCRLRRNTIKRNRKRKGTYKIIKGAKSSNYMQTVEIKNGKRTTRPN